MPRGIAGARRDGRASRADPEAFQEPANARIGVLCPGGLTAMPVLDKIAPHTGPSVGNDGTMYAGSGDGDYLPERQIYGQAMIGVKQNADTKALELKDWYAPSNAYWMRKRDLDFNASSPIFNYKGKEYLVSSSKECRLWLLDTSALGGEDHRTPVDRTPLFCNEEVNFTMGVWGALATWEESNGTRWILAPFWGPKHRQFKAEAEHGTVVYGAVAAFRLQEKAGKLEALDDLKKVPGVPFKKIDDRRDRLVCF